MYVLYKSKNILTLVTIGYIVGFIVGMYIEYCLWAQVAVLNHKLLYWTVGTGLSRFCIWVELPVQKRLCPIFVKNVGSPDIHECFRGLTGSQRTPGDRGVTFSLT